MTSPNQADTNLREKPDPRKTTGSLTRVQYEQNLQRALEAGPASIGAQIRNLLALCQLQDIPPSARPINETNMNVQQARLAAASSFGEVLSEEKIQAVIKDAAVITDPAMRAQMLTRLALYLPPKQYGAILRDIWRDIQTIKDPAELSRALLDIAPLLTLAHDEPAAPSSLLDVISQAQAIRSPEARLRALSALAPHLPFAMSNRTYQRILSEADQMQNDTQRANVLLALAEKLPEDLLPRAISSARAIENPPDRVRALTTLSNRLPEEQRPVLRAESLDGIASIKSEEERSEALIGFIPNLDFQADSHSFATLLEKALAIAIGFSRRQLRAKVLVVMAPHLSRDLQVEALAAVHSLSTERDRAMLLAELAPALPADMLVASLAVAHTMREQDARVHALSALAHYVQENARKQTVIDALAAASSLPNQYERVTELMGMIDILPDELRAQALTNALETTRLIPNENARARALNLIGTNLSETLLDRALEIGLELKDPQQRLNAMMGIAPYLNGEARLNAMKQLLQCAKDMPLEYKRTRALVAITPQLPLELLPQVQEMVDGLEDPFDKASVYMTLIQNLPPEQRPPLIAKTWLLMKRIDDGYDQTSILVSIATFLPPTADQDLAQVAVNAVKNIIDEYDKASAVSILAPLLAQRSSTLIETLPENVEAVQLAIEAALRVPHQALRTQLLSQAAILWVGDVNKTRTYELWKDILKQLKSLPLADVLLALGAIMPIIRELVGREGLSEVASILGVR